MKLPVAVLACLDRLEEAGFATYAVGGCVRDWLLGLTPHDYDLCTAATPAQMKTLFSDHGLVLAGEKHGTVGVVTDGGVVEITTFRTEGTYRDNRHPDRVEFVTDIEADLARRDFTVNAMAFSPSRGLCDPFGGREDLQNRILRAVGDPFDRFREDSLRILRGARFAVRFALTPEEATRQAMEQLAPLMDNLARERVFDELCKLLPLVNAEDLIQFAPVIIQVIPELGPCVGFDQHSRHHKYDVFTHTAQVVTGVPVELPLRWAALLHDVGKCACFTLDEQGQGHFYGHAGIGGEMADAILRRLKAPTQLRQQVVTLVAQHMTYPEPEKKPIRRRLSRLGETCFFQLLQLQEADTGHKGVGNRDEMAYFPAVRRIAGEILAENACMKVRDLAVNGHDLMALGIQGKAVGQTLDRLLELVLDEQVENEKTALLTAVQEM